ncbi:unnamed protein product [Lactuca virosa]|uniref:DUF4283 domain-containing protein n=1 Tax=Lactuca virosa TaxID=75947 RepID=A0AAU9NUP4_9ASTR|nr:unnamed protein product [Lactuca virosa]
MWDGSVFYKQRVTWVKICGIPVQFWDENVISVIVEKFGHVLIPANCSNDAKNLSSARVCILTTNQDYCINQWVEVQWKKVSFNVKIQEDGDWNPKINLSEEDSDSDNDLEEGEMVDSYDDDDACDRKGGERCVDEDDVMAVTGVKSLVVVGQTPEAGEYSRSDDTEVEETIGDYFDRNFNVVGAHEGERSRIIY